MGGRSFWRLYSWVNGEWIFEKKGTLTQVRDQEKLLWVQGLKTKIRAYDFLKRLKAKARVG